MNRYINISNTEEILIDFYLNAERKRVRKRTEIN